MWNLLAVKMGALNTHGVCTISLQAAVHPLTGPHTNIQLMLCKEIIAVFPDIRTKHLNAVLCNGKFLNVRPGSMSSNHWDLKG
jgi:hypothetical protein